MNPSDTHARREMVRHLVAQGVLRDPRVAQAMEDVPRHAFLPPQDRNAAHHDAPHPIGEGQTISAPHMVAIMAQALDVRPGHRVLEIGGGSGYHAAVLGKLAQPGGRVVTIERIPTLARRAEDALAPLGLPVEVHAADGSEGWSPAAPYDRISVAAAAPAIPPPLVDQLAPGGVLVIPVGPHDLASLLRVRKTETGLQEEGLGPVRFVPLLGKHGFPE